MNSIINQIAEYTRLCKEYSELPLNAETEEEYAPIECKRSELKQKIETSKKELERLRERKKDYMEN